MLSPFFNNAIDPIDLSFYAIRLNEKSSGEISH